MASVFMMLTACAAGGAKLPSKLASAPDPIIDTRFETRVVCPAELAQPVPPAVAVPAGAVIRANPAGDAFLDDKDARETLLAQRLTDAKAQCPR